MFLFEQTAIDLTLKRLDLTDQLLIVLLGLQALVGQSGLEACHLLFQFAECICVLAVRSPDFVLQVSQLKVHLGARMHQRSLAQARREILVVFEALRWTLLQIML